MASPFYLQTRGSLGSSSPLCLDADGSPPNPYTQLQLYTCEFDTPSTTDQLWMWHPSTSGSQVLINVNNGEPCPASAWGGGTACTPPQCLDVVADGSTWPPAPPNLFLQDCVLGGAASGNPQAWHLDPSGFLRSSSSSISGGGGGGCGCR